MDDGPAPVLYFEVFGYRSDWKELVRRTDISGMFFFVEQVEDGKDGKEGGSDLVVGIADEDIFFLVGFFFFLQAELYLFGVLSQPVQEQFVIPGIEYEGENDEGDDDGVGGPSHEQGGAIVHFYGLDELVSKVQFQQDEEADRDGDADDAGGQAGEHEEGDPDEVDDH